MNDGMEPLAMERGGEMSESYINQIEIDVLPGNRIDRKNAAKILGRSPKTLAKWKCENIGPRPIHVGMLVFYDLEEVMQMARGKKPIKPEQPHV